MRVTSSLVLVIVPVLLAVGPACESETDADPGDTRAETLSDLSATPETDTSTPGDDDTDTTNDTTDMGDDETASPDTAADTQAPGPDTAVCPPTGATGTALGDTLADTTLTTCDGSPVSLHSFCGRPLYINTFAGWCPPCRTDASNAATTAMTLPDGAQWLFVITENNSGTAPTTAYCASIRDTYGLTMPVLIDTAGTFPAHIGVGSPNSWHLVLDAGFGIVHRAKYDQRGALDALNALAP